MILSQNKILSKITVCVNILKALYITAFVQFPIRPRKSTFAPIRHIYHRPGSEINLRINVETWAPSGRGYSEFAPKSFASDKQRRTNNRTGISQRQKRHFRLRTIDWPKFVLNGRVTFVLCCRRSFCRPWPNGRTRTASPSPRGSGSILSILSILKGKNHTCIGKWS